MISFSHLFIALVLFGFIHSLGINECRILAIVCKDDPTCADQRVFYTKCLQRYVFEERDQVQPILIHKNIQKSQEKWLPDSIQYYRPFEPQENQDILTKADIREKLAALSDKASLLRDHTVTSQQYQPYFENNQDTTSSQIYPLQTYSSQELEDFHAQKAQKLQDIYSAYKRESVRESLKFLKNDLLNRQPANPYKYSLLKKSSSSANSNSQESDLSDETNKASPKVNSVNNLKKKKKEIVADTFHLIKSLLETEDKDREHKRIISDASDFITVDKANKQGKANIEVKSVDYEDLKKESEDNKQSVSNLNNLPLPVNREEVANLEVRDSYTNIESFDSEDTEDKGLLIVNALNSLGETEATKLGEHLQNYLWNVKANDHKIFQLESVINKTATYHMRTNPTWFESVDDAATVASKLHTDQKLIKHLKNNTGITVLSASALSPQAAKIIRESKRDWDKLTLLTAIIGGCSLALIVGAIFVCSVKRKNKDSSPVKLKRQEAVQDYQELCRTQMSVTNSRPEEEDEELKNKEADMKNAWNDDPFPYNMDITTGHVILAYMEDHLKNENRLNKEWEALCSYKADESETSVGADPKNSSKNRFRDVLPYDHTRVKLRETSNQFHSDYVNANFITDVDPRNPDYIATQGPLDNTVADFWQMIWENGVVVIVNLTKLSDMGLPQCHLYWPENGSEIYHIYEVHLISEHIWCDDYLVRSLYLKNLQTAETRTITQFHYLTWPDLSIPDSPKSLLEFRRKVNKCYRGHACPIIVHCNNGVGRTGTYLLLDMVLNKMFKGTKEIDIAATLEHLRDQRPDMVKTKGQFEFTLTAVAEEVTAILSAVPK